MTIEEKFWQLYMIPGGRDDPRHDYSRGVFGLQNRSARDARSDAALQNSLQRWFVDSTRLGIPIIPFEEAVHGVMRRGATVYPAAIALAATFDSTLLRDVAADIAREARSRGIRQVLSPVVNLANDVRWGRVEETYGEDPHLASVMGRVYVREMERRGVIATPKHFVANVGDGGRDSYPIDVSARLLRELHLPPFRASIVDAGARSVMTAYNSVNGLPASQNATLLNGILRRDWGFRGFVISDQAAVGGATVLHHTEASTATATKRAIEAGLDVIFQSSWEQHRPYLEAMRSGSIGGAAIDTAVARVLWAKFQLGLFEQPYVDVDSAGMGASASRTLARQAAHSSMVLLRNESDALPLPATTARIAVIGADAVEARLGGYTLDDARGVTILDALRERLGDRARFAHGPGRSAAAYVPIPAESFDTLHGEYFDNIALEGTPLVTRRDASIDFRWTFNAPARGIPVGWYSVRWTGRVRLPQSGPVARRIGVEGNDGYRLYVDGRLVIDNWRKLGYRTTLVPVSFEPGSVHDIRLEFFESVARARVRLVWDVGVDDAAAAIDWAVEVARESDVAIIVAGIEEGEFRDRAFLALPGRQEELIRRIAQLGVPVVVVMIGGSAITMSSWIEDVDAVLMAWYPGTEGGHAVVDVLFGDVNPAGRLPVTFPISEGQLPLTYNHKPTGRGDDYVDLTGHAAFPFGFGLSYTRFEYRDLRVTRDADAATIRFQVRNAGSRAGHEVPQLYVRDVLASVARPVMELEGFTRIQLAPGEEREVTFRIPMSQLRFLNEQMRWVVEPGAYRVLVGASSTDIRLRGDLVIP